MTAAKSATKATPKATTDAKTRVDEETAERASAMTTSAKNPPITSSEDAAQARQADDASDPAAAKTADEATPIAFPPVEAPANQAAVDNYHTMESRFRAKLVGESATAAMQGSTPDRAVAREVQIAGTDRTHQEVSLPAPNGLDEIVFTATESGDIEITTMDASQVNSLRGGGKTIFARMSGADWALVSKTIKSKTAAKAGGSTGQSAAEQRAGASDEGDSGPVAPQPIVL